MTTKEKLLHAGAAAAPYVVQRYTELRSTTDEAGFVITAVILVEVVAYVLMAVYYAWKIVRGRKQLVREERPEWRYMKRERVIGYSPATDKKHPNHERRR